MKRFKEVVSYFESKGYEFNNVRDNIVRFKDVKWSDYYELEGYRDICCVEVDYNYMNRKKYDVIVVESKKHILQLGCSVREIVNTAAMAVIDAQSRETSDL